MSTSDDIKRLGRLANGTELSDLINPDEGWIDRRIFWERSIYEQELERIFARAWCFVAHESQIPKSGDYVASSLGEDQVLVVRQRDNSIQVLVNSCPHRGNRVCHAEAGNARGFICNYHGWSFGLDGKLLGMQDSVVYERCGELHGEKMGLAKTAKVESYKGLVFATFDPSAPALVDYLGDFTWYLDAILDNDEGGTEFLPGFTKWTMRCNWKIAAENFCGDIYHAGWTHDSAAKAIGGMPVKNSTDDTTSYSVNVNGHGWEFCLDLVGNAATFGDKRVNKYLRMQEEKMRQRLGAFRSRMVGAVSSCTVFPNFSFLPGQNTFRVWQPRGPDKIELHTWVLVNKNAPQEVKDAWRKGAMMTFSPAGVFEMDDGENWEFSTRMNAGVVTRRQKLNYRLGLDSRIAGSGMPGNVHKGQISDVNQRAFYKHWAELMAAEKWSDVKLAPRTVDKAQYNPPLPEPLQKLLDEEAARFAAKRAEEKVK